MDKEQTGSVQQKIQDVLYDWEILDFIEQGSFPKQCRSRLGNGKTGCKKRCEYFDWETGTGVLVDKGADGTAELSDNLEIERYCYIGDIPRRALLDCLIGFLRKRNGLTGQAPKYIEFSDEGICAARIAMDNDGQFKDIELSPMLWGVCVYAKGDGARLSKKIERGSCPKEYQEANDGLSYRVKQYLGGGDGEPRPLKKKDIKQIAEIVFSSEFYKPMKEAIEAASKPYRSNKKYPRRQSTCALQVAVKGAGKSLSLSASFYSKDLQALRAEIENCSLEELRKKSAVISYLLAGFEDGQPERIDVFDDGNGSSKTRREFLRACLSDRNTPLGRWPSRYSPALMQQVAINMTVGRKTGICSKYPPEGMSYPANDIVSVNGPPGTGKTTLLKDIIAANVVEKARLLAEVESPDDIFEAISLPDKEKGYLQDAQNIYRIKPEYDALNDLGIIVCSSNNTAVENISFELPKGSDFFSGIPDDEKKVFLGGDGNEGLCELPLTGLRERVPKSAGSREKSDVAPDLYFSTAAAQAIKTNDSSGDSASTEARDLLVAARLGKRGNINGFLEPLKLVSNAIDAVCPSEAARGDFHIAKFNKARDLFIKQYNHVQSMMDKRAVAAERAFLNEQLDTLDNSFLGHLKQEARKAGFSDNQIPSNAIEVREFVERHRGSNRFFVRLTHAVNLFGKKCQPDNRSESDGMEELLQICQEYIDERAELVSQYPKDIADCCGCDEPDAKSVEYANGALIHDMCSGELGLRKRSQLFNPAPGPSDDAELSQARDILFLRALQVTREFVLSSPCMRSNLLNLRAYFGGKETPIGMNKERYVKYGDEDRKAIAPALFQALNILTPIISSTFASVQRMFEDISVDLQKKAPFGLLIVDEGGQAVPYAAVGALARCRRALVVGDPSQIPPVVKPELDGIRYAMQKDELPSLFLNKDASVQILADKANPVGTFKDASRSGEKLWIGCPLVVHRRCVSPIFDISNVISYDGQMINETPDLKEDNQKNNLFHFESSQWIDVKGPEKGEKNHYVQKQGQYAAQIVARAFDRYKDTVPNLFVITPFRTVETEFKAALKAELEGIETDSNRLKEFIDNNIGTVHRFQGRQAYEVIFLLGCDSNSTPAVDWVSANIVNVAASRAQYRLYVIGDQELWSRNDYVREMRDILVSFWTNHIRNWIKDPDSDQGKRELELARKMLPIHESIPGFGEESDVENLASRDEQGEAELKSGEGNTGEADLGEAAPVAGKGQSSLIDDKGFLLPILGRLGDVQDEVVTEDVYCKFGFGGKRNFEETLQCCDSGGGNRVADFVRMGMFLHTVFSLGEEEGKGVDQSFCCINFCCALELFLKKTYLPLLLQCPEKTDIMSHGKPQDNPSIGKYPHALKRNIECLVGQISGEKNASDWGDTERWNILQSNIEQAGKLRNNIAHPGRVSQQATGEILDELIIRLFKPEAFCNDLTLKDIDPPIMKTGEDMIAISELLKKKLNNCQSEESAKEVPIKEEQKKETPQKGSREKKERKSDSINYPASLGKIFCSEEYKNGQIYQNIRQAKDKIISTTAGRARTKKFNSQLLELLKGNGFVYNEDGWQPHEDGKNIGISRAEGEGGYYVKFSKEAMDYIDKNIDSFLKEYRENPDE